TWSPAWVTTPSITCDAPRSRAIVGDAGLFARYAAVASRETTVTRGSFDSRIVTSSANPTPSESLAGSPVLFSKGFTTIVGDASVVDDAPASHGRQPPSVATPTPTAITAAPSSATTRHGVAPRLGTLVVDGR